MRVTDEAYLAETKWSGPQNFDTSAVFKDHSYHKSIIQISW